MTATLFAHQLQQLTTSALAFASRDESFPAICAVRFSTEDGQLVARATDRYVLARLRVGCEGELDPVLVSRDDLRTVLRAFKTSRYSNSRVSVESLDGKVRFSTADALDTGPTMTVEVRTVEDAAFPGVDKLLDEARDAPTTADHVGLTPRVLTCAAKLPVSDRTPVLMRVTGANKPVYITADGHEALLMPVRLADHVEAAKAEAA